LRAMTDWPLWVGGEVSAVADTFDLAGILCACA